VPLVNTPGETGEVTVWLEMGVPTGGAHTGSVMGVGRGGTTSNFALLTIVYPESR